MDETSPKIVVVESQRRRGSGCVLAAVLLFAAVWCIGGVAVRSRLLANWSEDYAVARQAREHPIIARLVASESAVRAAEEFSADYENLQSSNVFTAALYAFETVASHKRLSAALGGATSEPEQGKGVRVETVQANSNAARAGLRIGDRITTYNGRPINSLADLSVAKADLLGGSATLTVIRDGSRLQLRVSSGQLGITASD